MRRNRGFTLIELMVAIAIVGILGAVSISALGSHKMKARDARRTAELSSIEDALNVYFMEHATFPATLDSIKSTFGSNLPKDPSTNLDYSYTKSDSPKKYCLGAKLETTVVSPSDCDSGSVDDNYKRQGP